MKRPCVTSSFQAECVVLVNLLRAATGRLHRFGYVAVAFGDPVRFRDMPQSARIAGLSDEQRRAVAKEVAAQLMERIASVIPATPVPLVARAALDLHCEATEGELAARVHELRSRLDELSVPTALGREFVSFVVLSWERRLREGRLGDFEP